MYLNKALGNFGENKACEYLKNNNYIILERNFKCKQGEIDIIAKDFSCNELVFIEVKTRSNYFFGSPAEAIDKNKIRHLINASKYYIFQHNFINYFFRFDVIEVFPKNLSFEINHLKQVI